MLGLCKLQSGTGYRKLLLTADNDVELLRPCSPNTITVPTMRTNRRIHGCSTLRLQSGASGLRPRRSKCAQIPVRPGSAPHARLEHANACAERRSARRRSRRVCTDLENCRKTRRIAGTGSGLDVPYFAL